MRVTKPHRAEYVVLLVVISLKPIVRIYARVEQFTGSAGWASAAVGAIAGLFVIALHFAPLSLPDIVIKEGMFHFDYRKVIRNFRPTTQCRSLPTSRICAIHLKDTAGPGIFRDSASGRIRRYLFLEVGDGKLIGPVMSEPISRRDRFKARRINEVAHQLAAAVGKTEIPVKTSQSREEILAQHALAKRNWSRELQIAIPGMALCLILFVIWLNSSRT